MPHRFFSTKVVSLDRGINTELKNIKNLLGKPLLKKLDDEAPKKVSPNWIIFLVHFLILLVKHNYSSTPIQYATF